MQNVLSLGILFCLLASGCGRPDVKDMKSPDEVLKEIAVNDKDITAILKDIKDDASFQAAKPKLEKAAGRAGELNAKLESFKLSEQQEAELAKKHPNVKEGREEAIAALSDALGKVPDKADPLNDILGKAGFPRIGIFKVPDKMKKALQ